VLQQVLELRGLGGSKIKSKQAAASNHSYAASGV
jgi:hypothetical protein